MNDKLTLNKLEKLIELETQLRGEYQQQLDDKDIAIAQLTVDKTALEAQISEREKTIATQLAAPSGVIGYCSAACSVWVPWSSASAGVARDAAASAASETGSNFMGGILS